MEEIRDVLLKHGWVFVKQENTLFNHTIQLRKIDPMLLVGIARELQLTHASGQPLFMFDETDYSHSPDAIKLKDRLAQILCAVPVQSIEPGDILLLRIDGNPQHLAIASDRQEGLGLIHSYAPARAVVEHDLDEWWHKRIESAFRYIS